MRRGRFSRRPCGSFRCPPQCWGAISDARRPAGRNHRRTVFGGDVYGHFGVHRYAVPACGRHKWRPYVYALRSSSWFDMRRGRFSRRPCGSFRRRLNVGAPFMAPVALPGEMLHAWGGTMVFPVAAIENSVATTGFSVRAIGFSVGAGNVRIAPSAIFPTPSAVSSGLRARLVVRGRRFRASMCRPRRADESVAMP